MGLQRDASSGGGGFHATAVEGSSDKEERKDVSSSNVKMNHEQQQQQQQDSSSDSSSNQPSASSASTDTFPAGAISTYDGTGNCTGTTDGFSLAAAATKNEDQNADTWNGGGGQEAATAAGEARAVQEAKEGEGGTAADGTVVADQQLQQQQGGEGPTEPVGGQNANAPPPPLVPSSGAQQQQQQQVQQQAAVLAAVPPAPIAQQQAQASISHLIPAPIVPGVLPIADPALAQAAQAAAAAQAAMRIAPFMGVHNLIPPGLNSQGQAQQQAQQHAAAMSQMQQMQHLQQQQQQQVAGANGSAIGGHHTHNLIPGYSHVHAASLAAQAQAQVAAAQQAQAAQAQLDPQAAQAAAAVAAQAQAQAHQAAAAAAQAAQVAAAALAANGTSNSNGGGGYPAPAQQAQLAAAAAAIQGQQPPNLIAADPRVSPVSFYGRALPPSTGTTGTTGTGAASSSTTATAITAAQQQQQQQQQMASDQRPPKSWHASQTPLHPIVPPNVPGLPHYGLPVDPTSHKPFQTLQDMVSTLGQANVIPTYNGINANYPGVRMLSNPDSGVVGGAGSTVPPIYAVDNFLSAEECDYLIACAGDSFTPAPVVGRGVGEVSVSRTSSTVYLAREDLPLYLEKVCRLVGKPRDHCELPQVGRYFPTQQYMRHFDAFDLSNEDGQRFASNGGQRTVTVLVYLNDVAKGGSTNFPALNLDVRPRRGMALVFFPATVDGLLDKNALHAALPAVDTKYVSQVWIRQGSYDGLPSKRIFPNEEVARKAAQTFRSGSNPLTIEGMLTLQQQAQLLQLQQQQLTNGVGSGGAGGGPGSAPPSGGVPGGGIGGITSGSGGGTNMQ